MSKCSGCGAKLQNKDSSQDGFTKDLKNLLCQRCFRIQNYNEYQKSIKSNSDYLAILQKIGQTDALVVLVIDLFHTISLEQIKSILSNDVILVLTKRDLLPYTLYEEKLIHYFKVQFNYVKETIIISSKNNYHYDNLYHAIEKYKKGKNVYIVGYTNAGKSTMINQLMHHYGDVEQKVTTSILPSTTLDIIMIPWQKDCYLIDTPGLLEENSVLTYLDNKELKKVIPKTEIKPKIYQLKKEVYFKVDNFLRLYLEKPGDIVFYFSNDLSIERLFRQPKDLDEYKKINMILEENEDLVITGMGFIKFKASMKIEIYVRDYMHCYKRKSYL